MIIITLPRGKIHEPPSACTGLIADGGVKSVTLRWTDPPESETVDRETVIWAGTKLVRKEGEAPIDWKDGTLVLDETIRNRYSEDGFTDTDVIFNTKYYYAVFPYSTKGAYGRGISASATPIERRTMDDYSWEELAQLADDIAAGIQDSGLLKLHETKDIQLEGTYNQKITAELADFNHDDKWRGGKAGLTYIIKNVLGVQKRMDQNFGPYDLTEMYDKTIPEIFDCFPDEVKQYIQVVLKPTESSSASIKDVQCKLFLLSEMEVFGEKQYSTGKEGTLYPIFGGPPYYTGADRGGEYWLRSLYNNMNNVFCCVSGGAPGWWHYAYAESDIVFGFCIGKKVKEFAEYTWEEIATSASDGTAKEKFKEGEEKPIQLTGKYAQPVTVRILDFGHDDLATGGKAGITLEFKTLMKQTFQMNDSDTNIGGYRASNMAETILPEILNCFPADLKPYVRTVKKKVGIGNNTDSTIEMNCDLFLLSEVEVFGNHNYSAEGEGEMYAYFTDYKSRTKRVNEDDVNGSEYWLRSPMYLQYGGDMGQKRFCSVTSTGSNSFQLASGQYYLSVAFCVGLDSGGSVIPDTPKSFVESSWAEISDVCESGKAKERFKKGDSKTIQMTGSYSGSVTLEIIDFYRDEKRTGGKAGITLACTELLGYRGNMNDTDTNEGGYGRSKMHREILPAILRCLPDDLRAQVKTVKKTTGIGGGSTSGTEVVNCDLFLFSEQELFGRKVHSVGNEGEQYELFAETESFQKEITDFPVYWFERSPMSGFKDGFCAVDQNGDPGAFPASEREGILFGLCI